MKEIFRRHPRPAEQHFEKSADNLWVRCPRCRELLYTRELEQSLWVCSKCKYHYPITAHRRVDITVDPGSFEEHDEHMHSIDPLGFQSLGESYAEKLEQYRRRAEAEEAFIYGTARIDGQEVVIGSSEFQFSGGSMGAVSGEKVARAIELAIDREIPLLIFSTGGGARMQEGTVSLLQMAKTIAALDRLKNQALPYFSIMTDPCLGGITASYAMLGDVNIAEPGAYIGFAGRRVIEQTMRQKLPADAATSEFLLKHGMLDLVVQRAELPSILSRLIKLYYTGTRAAANRRRVPQYA